MQKYGKMCHCEVGHAFQTIVLHAFTTTNQNASSLDKHVKYRAHAYVKKKSIQAYAYGMQTFYCVQ